MSVPRLPAPSAASPFYRLRTPEGKVAEALVLKKRGVSNRKIAQRVGVRPHPAGRWLRRASASSTQ